MNNSDKTHHRISNSSGFTLIETLAALFILGITVGALMSSTSSSLDTAYYLKNSTIAQWVAENRATEIRMSTTPLVVGENTGTIKMANTEWKWISLVSDTLDPNVFKVEIKVSLKSKQSHNLAELVTYANK